MYKRGVGAFQGNERLSMPIQEGVDIHIQEGVGAFQGNERLSMPIQEGVDYPYTRG